MKTLLILLLPITMFSQQMIGVHYSEVMELENAKTRTTTDGDHFITSSGEYYLWVHYFNEADYCWFSGLYPNSQEAMYAVIELFNEEYIVVSDTKWKIYSRGLVVDVKLDQDDDGSYLFVFFSESIKY